MKKILIFCLCFYSSAMITHANSSTTILLYGKDLPNILLITLQDNQQIDVLSIPTNLVLPLSCVNKSAALWTIASQENATCLQTSLQSNLKQQIDHTIYLHTDTIDQTFPQNKKGKDLNTMDEVIDYFSYLADQANFQMLWKYQDYITTDISLWELKDYFPIFTNKDLQMKYHALHLIGYDTYWYALDRTPYETLK